MTAGDRKPFFLRKYCLLGFWSCWTQGCIWETEPRRYLSWDHLFEAALSLHGSRVIRPFLPTLPSVIGQTASSNYLPVVIFPRWYRLKQRYILNARHNRSNSTFLGFVHHDWPQKHELIYDMCYVCNSMRRSYENRFHRLDGIVPWCLLSCGHIYKGVEEDLTIFSGLYLFILDFFGI